MGGGISLEAGAFGLSTGFSLTNRGFVGVAGADGVAGLDADISTDGLKFRKRSGLGAGDRGREGG